MMRALLCLLLLGFSFAVSASAFASTLVGLGAESRFERGSDQNLDLQNYYSGFISWQVANVFVGAEIYQGSTGATGNETYSVSSTRRGLWGTVMLPGKHYGVFVPYLDAGLGVMQDQVTSQLSGTASSDYGSPQVGIFGGLGTQFYFADPSWKHLFLAAEVRFVAAALQDGDMAVTPCMRLGFMW